MPECPAPHPGSPYLQGGQQSGQVGELLLEGLVLLLILAGGGAAASASRGRVSHPQGARPRGSIAHQLCASFPATLPSPCPDPPCPLHGGVGGAPDVCSLGWAQAVSQGCGAQGQGRRPGHSPLHSLQQQRLPLRQFVLEGQAAAGRRPSPAPPTAPTPWARPHWLGWRSLQQPAPPPGPSRSVPCRRAQCPPHKCHLLGKVSAAGQALASL